MKFKIIFILLFVFNIFAVLYLISPTPKLADLPNSIKSTEPGDTVQIPNVSAYYTNQTRTEVMNFFKANYNGLFRVQLNHPPEKAKTVIKDTIQTYYFEELVLPFKETIYINGFEWENDVFTKPEKRIQNKLLFEGKEYKAKITIRTFPVSVPKRLISFFLIEAIFISIVLIYKSFLKTSKK
jgi:hypothetical protein